MTWAEAALCIVRGLAKFVALTHWMPVAIPIHDNQKSKISSSNDKHHCREHNHPLLKTSGLDEEAAARVQKILFI